MKKNNEELVIRIFDENGPNVQDAILEAFRKYLDIELKKPFTYTQIDDYKLPDLTLKEINNKPLNKYGLLKLDYIKRNKKALYQQLLMTNELNNFLFSVGNEAQEMVEELDKHQDNLNKANQKSVKLDNTSNEVKDIVENLKNSFGSKDKYTLKQEDKDKILDYIEQVNDTNNDYKNMKRLSNTLNNVDKELKENCDIINTLTENNEALNLRVNTLTNKLTKKEEEIDNLTNDNNNLKKELTKWKNRFLNIINFIKNRLLRPKDKDKYKEFTIDLYTHGAIDEEIFMDIKDNYSKDNRKADFER